MTHAPLAVLAGELSSNTQITFFADVAMETWLPLGLIFTTCTSLSQAQLEDQFVRVSDNSIYSVVIRHRSTILCTSD